MTEQIGGRSGARSSGNAERQMVLHIRRQHDIGNFIINDFPYIFRGEKEPRRDTKLARHERNRGDARFVGTVIQRRCGKRAHNFVTYTRGILAFPGVRRTVCGKESDPTGESSAVADSRSRRESHGAEIRKRFREDLRKDAGGKIRRNISLGKPRWI